IGLVSLRWSRRKFHRLKSAAPMGTVAEGFVLGLPATAKCDGVLAGRGREGVAKVVDDFDGPLDYIRAVFPAADDDRFAHDAMIHTSPQRQQGTALPALRAGGG